MSNPNPLIIFDGQSFNYAPLGGARTYPLRTWDRLPSGLAVAVVGISATSYSTRAGTVASRVDPLLKNAAVVVIVDAGGPTDLGVDSLTAAQTLAASEAYADARRSINPNVKLIELTVTPGTTLYVEGTENAERLAYNDLLRANVHGKFDRIADIAAIPGLADPAGVNYSDGLHPSAAGCDLMAALIAPLILEVL